VPVRSVRRDSRSDLKPVRSCSCSCSSLLAVLRVETWDQM
jgi:hypothetical protein